MQTNKGNNLPQDQSLWLVRCVTLNISITQALPLWAALSTTVWFQYEHPTLTYCSFFFSSCSCLLSPPPSSYHWYDPSLFLILDVKGVGEGATVITQEGNLYPVLQKLQHYKVVAKYSRRCFALVEKIDEQIKQGKTTITRSKELSQALFLTLYGRSEAEKYSILEKLANQEIKVSEIKKVSGTNFLFCFYFLYFYFKKG